MSFFRESEQQLLAVNDIRPPARRRVEQLREMPGVRHGVSRLCRWHRTEVWHRGPQSATPAQAADNRDPEHVARKAAIAGKPSVGLEPTTPSLPWKGEGVTSVHGRPRSGTKCLQINLKWSVRLWWAKCGRSGTGGRKMNGTPVRKCVAAYQGRPFSRPVSRRRGLGSAPCHLSRATPLGRVPTTFSSGRSPRPSPWPAPGESTFEGWSERVRARYKRRLNSKAPGPSAAASRRG